MHLVVYWYVITDGTKDGVCDNTLLGSLNNNGGDGNDNAVKQ